MFPPVSLYCAIRVHPYVNTVRLIKYTLAKIKHRWYLYVLIVMITHEFRIRKTGKKGTIMSVVTKYLDFSTKGNAECVDITPGISNALDETGLDNGVLTVFVPGATGALTTVEYEPGLVRDMEELWERIIPGSARYHHDMTWGDGNGHSHLRATLLGPSISVPFCSGALTLGTWQQVIFIDFDIGSRTRKLVLQFMGE